MVLTVVDDNLVQKIDERREQKYQEDKRQSILDIQSPSFDAVDNEADRQCEQIRQADSNRSSDAMCGCMSVPVKDGRQDRCNCEQANDY